MLYYRTQPGRGGILPAELVGYTSTGPNADLHDQIVDGRRVVGISPPLRFAPPTTGWMPLADGWEAASAGAFEPKDHIRLSSGWKLAVMQISGQRWALPHVLTPEGGRAFSVSYGGPDFAAQLTLEQERALALAQEVRTALDSDTMPDMPVRARWAARLLPLAYHLSEGSLRLLGMSEDVIDQTLRVAAGRYAQR